MNWKNILSAILVFSVFAAIFFYHFFLFSLGLKLLWALDRGRIALSVTLMGCFFVIIFCFLIAIIWIGLMKWWRGLTKDKIVARHLLSFSIFILFLYALLHFYGYDYKAQWTCSFRNTEDGERCCKIHASPSGIIKYDTKYVSETERVSMTTCYSGCYSKEVFMFLGRCEEAFEE